MVVGAPRGAFKTWLAMDLALALGSGKGSVLGAFPVVAPSRVLILHGELDPWSAYWRWTKLVANEKPTPSVAQSFEPWRLRVVRSRTNSTYKDEDGIHREQVERLEGRIDAGLRNAVMEYDFDVVIVDPYASFFVGAESSNDEVEAGLSALSEFTRELGLTFIMFHHFSQSGGGRDPEDQWRGATRLPDWASLRLTLDPYYDKKQAKKQGLSRSEARRYAWARFLARRDETPPDMPIRFDLDAGRWTRWHDATQVADDRRKDLSPDAVMDMCRQAGGSWPSIRKAAEDLGIAQGTAKKVLTAAVRAGKLVEFEGARGAQGFRVATSWDSVGGSR